MSVTYGGAHFDWPLSRDEKKQHVMHLYDKELEATVAAGPGHMLEPQSSSVSECIGIYKEERNALRLSDVSTADTEHSIIVQTACDELPLDTITEEAEAPGDLTAREIGAVIDSAADDIASSIAERLRVAVASRLCQGAEIGSAVEDTLRVFGTAAQLEDVDDQSASRQTEVHLWRRSASEDMHRGVAPRRSSFGRRDGQRRTSRGSRHRSGSRSDSFQTEMRDSDGAEGDTEEPHRRSQEIAEPRRRWQMWNQKQAAKAFSGRRTKSCDSILTHLSHSSLKAPSTPRLRPVLQADSLQDFLGETVPECPF